jgi:methylated-DNA-[protein]-cysteine S-methyltransferase
VYHWEVDSPVGRLLLTSNGSALTGVSFPLHTHPVHLPDDSIGGSAPFADTIAWLDAYFAAKRPPMDIPITPVGTPFQQRVWAALLRIPYGTTRSYGQIAKELGDPKTVRAVGAANGQNPISILVPCHRVIGANGDLVGFGGGLDRKRWLLDHEAGRLSLF